MFQRILVPLDGSDESASSLPHAMAAAEALGAEIRLFHVLSSSPGERTTITDPVQWRFLRAKASGYLARLMDHIRRQGIPVEREIAEGEPAGEIQTAARRWAADLLVMSSYGGGGSRGAPHGSTTLKVMGSVGTSILVVPGRPAEDAVPHSVRYRKIMVPLDCSPGAEATLGLAAALAGEGPGEILIAHVVPVPELIHGATPLDSRDIQMREQIVARNRRLAESYLERCARLADRPGITSRTLLGQSTRIHHTLAGMVEEEMPDLVLMSAHGQGSHRERPNSPYGVVSGHLLSYGSAPILIVQEEETIPETRTKPDRFVNRPRERTRLW